jgi:rod shape-determining protein MreD
LLLIVLTLILDLTVFDSIEFWGLRPDPTPIMIVYVALGMGPMIGALFGFMVGLAEFAILMASVASMPLAGTVVGFLAGRYGTKIMHENYLVQVLIIILAVVVMDSVNLTFSDPGRLLITLVRSSLLGGAYTAIVGVTLALMADRIVALRPAF